MLKNVESWRPRPNWYLQPHGRLVRLVQPAPCQSRQLEPPPPPSTSFRQSHDVLRRTSSSHSTSHRLSPALIFSRRPLHHSCDARSLRCPISPRVDASLPAPVADGPPPCRPTDRATATFASSSAGTTRLSSLARKSSAQSRSKMSRQVRISRSRSASLSAIV